MELTPETAIDTNQARARMSVGKMAIRFILSLAFLALIVAFNYLLGEQRITETKFIASVMDNMGRQQMLAQRIALLSQSMVDSPFSTARAHFKQELLDYAATMDKMHEDLIRGELSKKLPQTALSKVQSVYLAEPYFLEKDIKRFISAARNFAESAPEQLTADNPYFLYIHSLAKSDALVKALNKVVSHYQEESSRTILRSVMLGRVQLGLFLMILVGMAVFVFWPMARQIKAEISGLEEINTFLDQQSKNLTASNKKLLDKENALMGIMEDLAVQKKMLQGEVVERQKAEKALREEKTTAQMYLDIAGTIFILIDKDKVLRLINRKGCQVFGYNEDEMIGKNYFDHFLAPESVKQYQVMFENVFSGDQEFLEYVETVILRKDGERRTVAWHNTYLKDEQGQVTATLSSGEDITERIAADENRRLLMNKLAVANRELNDFSYVVSHDLKAPLRGIGSLATWIANDYKDKLDAEAKESLDLLIGRVKRMQDLIDGLLQLAKIGRTEGEPQIVDLNEAVSSIVDLINPPKSITVTLDKKLPVVFIDRTRIQQVFQNLLSNAVKYMDKPRGQISVRATEDDGFWKFYVQDNGPGIDAKHHEKIFQIFQTLAPKDSSESTGIGLSLVKKIVETSGGKVWIESEHGKGSTFIFTLPKMPERNLAHAA